MIIRYKKFLISLFLSIVIFTQCSCTYFAIEQCPGSDVISIRHQTKSYEISLIFYYTNWSEDSLNALQLFNDVAEYFGDKVYFATIDCWHLSCNCSKALTTNVGSGSPHKWPTLVVYYGTRVQLKIQYNGLYTLRDMIQFVENLMYPLERVERGEELDKMESYTDGLVLGVFKKPTNLEYQNYLIAALKWLEHDPVRTYRFTVNFSNYVWEKNSNDTNGKTMPNIYLMAHKTVKPFTDYSDFKWNSSNILRWLHQELYDDYTLLHGYTTPIMIGQKLKKQPVLAIFVNKPNTFFPYMEKYVDSTQPFTKMVISCKKSVFIQNLQQSLEIPKIYQKLEIFTDDLICHYIEPIILKNLQFYYKINKYLNELFQKFSHPTISKTHFNLNSEVKGILDFIHSIGCVRNNNIDLQISLHISVVKRIEAYLANEQQCKNSNRTLAVVLLDTQRYSDYLNNIDIQPNPQSMATAFIADNENENIYVMDDFFAMYNLMEFVKKFYENGLSNYYKNENILPKSLSSPSIDSTNYDIEIKHLNRQIFSNNLQYVHNQTLVVLIYSPDCALCANIQHTFIQLSLALRDVMDLKFVRINAMDNDLPWQYNMPFLPALLVFPENRFSESRIFPMHLKPDERNVFGFILSQLSPHQQVRLVLAACQSGSLPKSHSQSCWQFAKTILMQHIGKHLYYWQIFEAERNLIFERLRAFKDMSLDIQRNLRL